MPLASFPRYPYQFSALVVQWIEYRPPKPRVAGSIPAERAIPDWHIRMEYQDYLADLRRRYPEEEGDFLRVKDIAKVMSMEPEALRSAMARGSFPIASKRVGGVGVTVGEMAEYLYETSRNRARAPKGSETAPLLRPPTGRNSLAGMIAAAREQASFLIDLASELEAISLRGGDEGDPPLRDGV